MKISAWVAQIGQSPAFVTAMAHAWFAYAVIATCVHFGLTLWVVVPVAIALAAGKEYIFDLRFEKTPPQTLFGSTEDFLEYLAGIALALLVFR